MSQAPTGMSLTMSQPTAGAVDFVRIDGEVDLADAEQLGQAARQLVNADASDVYVDLGEATFIGSTLIGFLAQVADNAGVQRPLIVCRPTPAARRLLSWTRLDEIATVRPDLPTQWPGPSGPAPDPEPGSLVNPDSLVTKDEDETR